MTPKRTGVFGGSFNPIHNGHLTLASHLLREAGLDEVWLLVTPQNPWKRQADLLDDEHRLAMARRAVRRRRGLVASDYEMGLPRPSYTWHTLQALSRDFPDRAFTLLVGGDNWVEFDRWYAHDEILAHYPVVVYPRRDADIDVERLPEGVRVVTSPLMDVSSTEIRQRVRDGLPIDHLVPRTVADYIAVHGLYR